MSASKGLDARAAEIARLYADGSSQRELARTLGVARSSVQRLMRRHAMTARPASPCGAANSEWKGDEAGYFALHQRVSFQRGRPSRCERCGLDEAARVYHWANLTGNYADVNDYERMCVPCHRRYDADRIRAGGMSAAEACERLGITHNALLARIRAGLLEAERPASGKNSPWRITEQALADYLARRSS